MEYQDKQMESPRSKRRAPNLLRDGRFGASKNKREPSQVLEDKLAKELHYLLGLSQVIAPSGGLEDHWQIYHKMTTLLLDDNIPPNSHSYTESGELLELNSTTGFLEDSDLDEDDLDLHWHLTREHQGATRNPFQDIPIGKHSELGRANAILATRTRRHMGSCLGFNCKCLLWNNKSGCCSGIESRYGVHLLESGATNSRSRQHKIGPESFEASSSSSVGSSCSSSDIGTTTATIEKNALLEDLEKVFQIMSHSPNELLQSLAKLDLISVLSRLVVGNKSSGNPLVTSHSSNEEERTEFLPVQLAVRGVFENLEEGAIGICHHDKLWMDRNRLVKRLNLVKLIQHKKEKSGGAYQGVSQCIVNTESYNTTIKPSHHHCRTDDPIPLAMGMGQLLDLCLYKLESLVLEVNENLSLQMELGALNQCLDALSLYLLFFFAGDEKLARKSLGRIEQQAIRVACSRFSNWHHQLDLNLDQRVNPNPIASVGFQEFEKHGILVDDDDERNRVIMISLVDDSRQQKGTSYPMYSNDNNNQIDSPNWDLIRSPGFKSECEQGAGREQRKIIRGGLAWSSASSGDDSTRSDRSARLSHDSGLDSRCSIFSSEGEEDHELSGRFKMKTLSISERTRQALQSCISFKLEAQKIIDYSFKFFKTCLDESELFMFQKTECWQQFPLDCQRLRLQVCVECQKLRSLLRFVWLPNCLQMALGEKRSEEHENDKRKSAISCSKDSSNHIRNELIFSDWPANQTRPINLTTTTRRTESGKLQVGRSKAQRQQKSRNIMDPAASGLGRLRELGFNMRSVGQRQIPATSQLDRYALLLGQLLKFHFLTEALGRWSKLLATLGSNERLVKPEAGSLLKASVDLDEDSQLNERAESGRGAQPGNEPANVQNQALNSSNNQNSSPHRDLSRMLKVLPFDEIIRKSLVDFVVDELASVCCKLPRFEQLLELAWRRPLNNQLRAAAKRRLSNNKLQLTGSRRLRDMLVFPDSLDRFICILPLGDNFLETNKLTMRQLVNEMLIHDTSDSISISPPQLPDQRTNETTTTTTTAYIKREYLLVLELANLFRSGQEFTIPLCLYWKSLLNLVIEASNGYGNNNSDPSSSFSDVHGCSLGTEEVVSNESGHPSNALDASRLHGTANANMTPNVTATKMKLILEDYLHKRDDEQKEEHKQEHEQADGAANLGDLEPELQLHWQQIGLIDMGLELLELHLVRYQSFGRLVLMDLAGMQRTLAKCLRKERLILIRLKLDEQVRLMERLRLQFDEIELNLDLETSIEEYLNERWQAKRSQDPTLGEELLYDDDGANQLPMEPFGQLDGLVEAANSEDLNNVKARDRARTIERSAYEHDVDARNNEGGQNVTTEGNASEMTNARCLIQTESRSDEGASTFATEAQLEEAEWSLDKGDQDFLNALMSGTGGQATTGQQAAMLALSLNKPGAGAPTAPSAAASTAGPTSGSQGSAASGAAAISSAGKTAAPVASCNEPLESQVGADWTGQAGGLMGGAELGRRLVPVIESQLLLGRYEYLDRMFNGGERAQLVEELRKSLAGLPFMVELVTGSIQLDQNQWELVAELAYRARHFNTLVHDSWRRLEQARNRLRRLHQLRSQVANRLVLEFHLLMCSVSTRCFLRDDYETLGDDYHDDATAEQQQQQHDKNGASDKNNERNKTAEQRRARTTITTTAHSTSTEPWSCVEKLDSHDVVPGSCETPTITAQQTSDHDEDHLANDPTRNEAHGRPITLTPRPLPMGTAASIQNNKKVNHTNNNDNKPGEGLSSIRDIAARASEIPGDLELDFIQENADWSNKLEKRLHYLMGQNSLLSKENKIMNKISNLSRQSASHIATCNSGNGSGRSEAGTQTTNKSNGLQPSGVQSIQVDSLEPPPPMSEAPSSGKSTTNNNKNICQPEGDVLSGKRDEEEEFVEFRASLLEPWRQIVSIISNFWQLTQTFETQQVKWLNSDVKRIDYLQIQNKFATFEIQLADLKGELSVYEQTTKGTPGGNDDQDGRYHLSNEASILLTVRRNISELERRLDRFKKTRLPLFNFLTDRHFNETHALKVATILARDKPKSQVKLESMLVKQVAQCTTIGQMLALHLDEHIEELEQLDRQARIEFQLKELIRMEYQVVQNEQLSFTSKNFDRQNEYEMMMLNKEIDADSTNYKLSDGYPSDWKRLDLETWNEHELAQAAARIIQVRKCDVTIDRAAASSKNISDNNSESSLLVAKLLFVHSTMRRFLDLNGSLNLAVTRKPMINNSKRINRRINSDNCDSADKTSHSSNTKSSKAAGLGVKKLVFHEGARFLELVRLYAISWLDEQRKIRKTINLIERDLVKVNSHLGDINELEQIIKRLEGDEMRDSSKQDREFLSNLERKRINLELEMEILATKESQAINEQRQALEIRDQCIAEIHERAIPAIRASTKALDKLDARWLRALRSFRPRPTKTIRLVVEATCLVASTTIDRNGSSKCPQKHEEIHSSTTKSKGHSRSRTNEPNNNITYQSNGHSCVGSVVSTTMEPERRFDSLTGLIVEDYWPAAYRMLNGIHSVKFVYNLRSVSSRNLPVQLMRLIRRKYLSSPLFQLSHIERVSEDAAHLARWLIAVDVFDRVIQVVKPNYAHYLESEKRSSKLMEQVEKRRLQLELMAKELHQMDKSYERKISRKMAFSEALDQCRKQVSQVQDCSLELKDKRAHLELHLRRLGESERRLPDKCLVNAAKIVYLESLGSFEERQLGARLLEASLNSGNFLYDRLMARHLTA